MRLLAPTAAHYGEYARITGVNRRYGEYISFNCLWSPRIARRAAGGPHHPVDCHRPGGAPSPPCPGLPVELIDKVSVLKKGGTHGGTDRWFSPLP